MPYILEICRAGMTIEYRKYYTGRYGIKGIPRRKKHKPTSEEQLRINFREALRKLTRKINHNFRPGDYHLVLSYEKDLRPDTWEDMTKDIQEFLKRLRRACKKEGIVIRYIRVMERGKKGARHHHMVINEIPAKILRKCWKKGRIHINPLDDSGQYRQLAVYLLKFTDEAVRSGELKKRWEPSKGLKDPEITKKIISRRYYRDTVNVKKGYYLDKDSLQEYVDANGNRVFSYTIVKIRGDTS